MAAQSPELPAEPGRGFTSRCGPTRLTSTAISKATRPTSALAVVSAARQLPSPAAVTNRKKFSISTMVCRTRPPPKCRPAPRARLCIPAAIAARCSASSRFRPVDAPTTSPSRVRITALLISVTRVTRSSSSQLRSLVKPGSWPPRSTTLATRPPVLAGWLGLVRARGPGVRRGRDGGVVTGLGAVGAVAGARRGTGRRHVKDRPATFPALLDGAHRGAGVLGGAGPEAAAGARCRFRRGLTKLGRQARLPDPPRQPGSAEVAGVLAGVAEPACLQLRLGLGEPRPGEQSGAQVRRAGRIPQDGHFGFGPRRRRRGRRGGRLLAGAGLAFLLGPVQGVTPLERQRAVGQGRPGRALGVAALGDDQVLRDERDRRDPAEGRRPQRDLDVVPLGELAGHEQAKLIRAGRI